MTISAFAQLAAEYGLSSYSVPCPDTGDYGYVVDTLDAGQLIQHTLHFAHDVRDCLSKQVALHRWAEKAQAVR